MAETEQNKTEEATPFKLKRAREKGTVARGTDLAFFSVLVALMLFAMVAGADAIRDLMQMMHGTLTSAMNVAAEPGATPFALAAAYMPAMQPVALLGATTVLIVGLFEIVQIRGLVFSAQPLKPDFSRLNPAKGLKRLFSMRMLKETLKNVVKMAAYSAAAALLIRYAFQLYGPTVIDASSLSEAMHGAGMRLLFLFALLALMFAALDQVLARREFSKQMRMSKSELTREIRDREGDPRIKQRRRQLHAEFTKQARNLGDLNGSDMLVVNPEHYAVGLAYNAKTMSAPTVTAKGRNQFALQLKRQAATFSVAIFESPALARALYKSLEKGDEVSAQNYRAVADLYIRLNATQRSAASDV